MTIFSREYIENRYKLDRVLSGLNTLNIKFKNGNPYAATATLFLVNQQVMSGNVNDTNTGVSYQNAILGANIPSNVTTPVYSNEKYLFAGTDQGIWIYDRIKNIGTTINNVTNVSVENELLLTFDNIANAGALVGDASSVSDWNTFFDLPTNGISFTSVVVIENSVNLRGGRNINLYSYIFKNNTHLLSVVDNLGCIISGVYGCFQGCTSITTVDLPAIRTINYDFFNGCTSALFISLPSLITAPLSSFSNCSSVLLFDLPALTSAETAFVGCTSVIAFNLPNLVTAGLSCFSGCGSVTIFDLPKVTTIGDYCFNNCASITTLNLSSCISLGTTVANDNVFDSISGKTINLIIPDALLTCDAGSPDGDIIYLAVHNSVTINGSPYVPFTGFTGDLLLTFDNIANADAMIGGDSSDVADWNTFFNLPTSSTPFTSVNVVGNTVNLIGGENITLITSLFGNSGHGDSLLGIEDDGCIVYADDNVFGNHVGIGCPNLATIVLPSLNTAGDYCFRNCDSVLSLNLPVLTSAGDYCFSLSGSIITFTLPSLRTAGTSCFFGCIAVISYNFPSLVSAGNVCFQQNTASSFTFPSLTTAGDSCFNLCSSALSFTFPSLTTAGAYCFSGCSAAVTFNLPQLTTANTYCFKNCTSAITFNLPLLSTANSYCFSGCSSILTFDLPTLATIGDSCFSGCVSVTTFDLPVCVSLGDNTLYNYVFLSISGNTIDLTIPASLMTCNGGSPDGDITYFSIYNSVTINGSPYVPFTGFTGDLLLTFDNIANADAMIGGDSSDVADWNTFFNLPTSSTPFTSVNVVGNTVNLIGGENIILLEYLFGSSGYGDSLLGIEDDGCVVFAENDVFSDSGGWSEGCYNLSVAVLPSLNTASDACFYDCYSLATLTLPLLRLAGSDCFGGCPTTVFSFPELIIAGDYAFYYCTSTDEFDLPKLKTVLASCFDECSSATIFNLPKLETAGDYCFYNCSSTTIIDLPKIITAGDYCFQDCSLILSFNYSLLQSAGYGCFSYCTSATTFDLPVLTSAGAYCFYVDPGVTTFNLPLLATAGESCFDGCAANLIFDLPQLITAGDYCFYDCTSATEFTLSSCTALGTTVGDDDVFANITGNTITLTIPNTLMTCNSGSPDGDIATLQANNTVTIVQVIIPLIDKLILTFDDIANADALVGDASSVSDWNTFFDLPAYGSVFTSVVVSGNIVNLIGGSGITAKSSLLSGNNHLLSIVDTLSYIDTLETNCFYGCTVITTINLPGVKTIGNNCFENCTSATEFTLSSCTALGTTVGDDDVFANITGNTITLTIPNTLMTCNSGSPDGDIATLQANNTVTIITTPDTLILAFDDIANADALVGDASSVSDWNTFFDLPAYGSVFTSVVVSGNIVNLIGGSGITAKDSLFANNSHIYSILDTSGCLISAGNYCFDHCTLTTNFNLPALTTAGISCFEGCISATIFDLKILTTAGLNCFKGCTSALVFYFPYMTSAGNYAFQNCTSLKIISAALLVIAGTGCFYGCSAITTFDFPKLQTIGNNCFENCTSATEFTLSSCTALGTTVGDDNVFDGITGNTIILTVPVALFTCNSGDLEGDIAALQTANIVKLVDGYLPKNGNSVNHVFYDEVNYMRYVATNGGGLWAYDLVNNRSVLYTTSTIVTGDTLPSNTLYAVCVDTTNNIVYVGTNAGLWRYTVATNTGKLFNTSGGVTSGNNLPSNTLSSISIDYLNGYIWVGTNAGVWRYRTATGNGKTYNTAGGAGTGDQLPDNDVSNVFYSFGADTLYAGTANGIWAYNITTDTGLVINTLTSVIGDPLPSNTITAVYHDSTNDILYAGTDAGLWIYNITLGTGKVYDTTVYPTIGVPLPDNDVTGIWLDSGGDLSVSTNGGGLWVLNISVDYGQTYQPNPYGVGSLPSNVVYGVSVCQSSNILYAATLGGLLKWNVATNTGTIFTSAGGAGLGNQLPSNICICVYYDTTNNIVYVGTSLGLWRYTISTDTGKAFTTAGGAGSGDQLPNNFVHGIFVDETTDKVYVGTDGGFWIYDTLLDTGKAFTTAGGAGSGDQLPYYVITDCAKYTGSNYVWATTAGGGLWRYDEVLDVGKTYNTTSGASNGQQLPSNFCWGIALESNEVWIANDSGIWDYVISLDTGLVINSSTVVVGDSCPDGTILSINIDITNQILYAGSQNWGLWQYQILINTGKLFNTSGGQSLGVVVPENNIQSIYKDSTNGNLWAATKGGGIWQYTLNSQGLIGQNIYLSTSAYDYIRQTIDITSNPIVIFMMKIALTGSLTLNNVIKYTELDMFGNGYQNIIRVADYVSAYDNHSRDIIDIPIPKGILIDQDHYFEYPLDSLEEVDITIYYARLAIANILKRQLSLIEFKENYNPLNQ